MIYYVGLGIILAVIVICWFSLKDEIKHNKNKQKPWRVAKNGLGKYLLQNYRIVVEYNMHRGPSTSDWGWVTVETFDDSTDAIIRMNFELAKFKEEQNQEKEFDKLKKQKDKEKALEKKIIEIIK